MIFAPEPGKLAEITLLVQGTDTVTYLGRIETPLSYLTCEQFQMNAGKDAYKGFSSRVIAKARILDLVYLDGTEVKQVKKLENQDYEKLVPGSKGNFYTVKFAADRWTCTCPGFGFRGQCKHIKEAKDEVNSDS